jgi:hypothetical protein
MASDDAELSSITTALDELRQRITILAERNAGADDETLAQGLFDVEPYAGSSAWESGRKCADGAP